MTTKDHDTDPSTPSARRPVKGRSSAPPPPAEDTDPGVAPPPPQTRTPSNRPLGIVVPPASSPPPPLYPRAGSTDPSARPPAPKKDSVELLLEGMAEQRLDRPKTMPQTDGQASAAYHAEHRVRGATRQPPEAGPKVQLERPATPTAVRTARAAKNAGGPSAEATADSTMALPSDVTRRVGVALAAGLLVVVAIFAALHWAAPPTERAPAGETVTSPTTLIPKPIPPARSVLPPPAETRGTPVAPPAAAGSSEATPAAATAVPAASPTGSTPSPAPRRRSRPTAPPSASHDWGEFKTSF